MKIATIKKEESPLFLVPKHEGLSYLEQLAVFANCCPNLYTPFMYQVDEENKRIILIKTACKMWSCPSCGAKNAIKWIARIIKGMNEIDVAAWRFATVTSHGKWRGLASIKNIRSNWPKLRKRLKRNTEKRGEQLYYVRNWEHHKDKSFHMHFVTNAGVTTRWMKDNAAKCGLGNQAKINDTFNPGQAAGYMAKYMVKQLASGLHVFPKGARRFDTSGNWVKWIDYDKTDWYYSGKLEATKSKINYWKYAGYSVFDLAVRNAEQKIKKEIFYGSDEQ